ncbi:MAG: PAS domain-containing protein [Alphaproteobacteria bacterium]|nr:PAS domain-containing protein [Alphaproteobacteria bacterium]
MTESIPGSVSRAEIKEELPQGMERRLVLRLLTHWRAICGDRDFPSFSEVEPNDMPDMWHSCFVLEVVGHEDDPVFRTAGGEIFSYAPGSLIGTPVSNWTPDTLIGVAVRHTHGVLRKRVPMSHGDEFVKIDGTRVLYRSILLPMSDDGETISGLLGAANCREVHEE